VALNLSIQSYSAPCSLKKTATRSVETFNTFTIHRWQPRRPETSFECNLVSVSSVLFTTDAGALRCDAASLGTTRCFEASHCLCLRGQSVHIELSQNTQRHSSTAASQLATLITSELVGPCVLPVFACATGHSAGWNTSCLLSINNNLYQQQGPV
jgi:hypothetical protein